MEEIRHPDASEFVGPPEPVAVTHQAGIIPNGRAHMALRCWEGFAWQHLAAQNLRPNKEEDVLDVHAALARMLFGILFPDNIWTPHCLQNFTVGRHSTEETRDGRRWRLRDITYRVPLTLEGEVFEEGDIVPYRLLKVNIGPYDA